MTVYSTHFGIDSHLRTTTICAFTPADGEVVTRTFRGNDYAAMRDWMAAAPSPALAVYESGCTGFVPARELAGGGVNCVPIATSKMPTSADSRAKKNDKDDAMRLARLSCSGELKHVWVPDEQTEGLRELSQAIADAAERRQAARQRVNAFLCRHGIVWDERTPSGAPKKKWGSAHWKWLRGVDFPDTGSRAAWLAALAEADHAESAYDDIEAAAAAVAAESALAPAIDAMQAVKGVGFVTALAYAAEVGDFWRFSSGRKVTSYFGLAPRESSSADSRRLGKVSRNGCTLVRRLLTEAAWCASRGNPARAKKCKAGVPASVREHAHSCSCKIARRRRAMLARKVNACIANTATAAELSRMLLYVGRMAQEAAGRQAVGSRQ